MTERQKRILRGEEEADPGAHREAARDCLDERDALWATLEQIAKVDQGEARLLAILTMAGISTGAKLAEGGGR